MSFKNKVVIITGSSSGIGRECALLFTEGGASVTIHGQNPERLKETEDLLKKAGIQSCKILSILGPIEKDETQKRLINETVKKFGWINVLVNNAGLSHRPDLDPNSIENFDYVVNTNLRSVIALTRLAVPYLEKSKGNVVNVSSIGAQRGSAAFQPYVLTKAALDHLTKNMALEYSEKRIRVNTVSPGVTATNFLSRNDTPKEIADAYMKNIINDIIPMRRLGTAREIANVIEFLASDKASYVTGSNYVVDGGILTGSPSPSQQL